MNFTLAWQPEAEDQLADLWASATDRAMVTWAAREIDQRLGRDPLDQGEQRDGTDRLLFVPPLAVLFRVDVQTHRVYVVSVAWSGRPI